MFNEWQLSPETVAQPDTEGPRSDVLARLLDEAERAEEAARQAVPRPTRPAESLPRPFAFD